MENKKLKGNYEKWSSAEKDELLRLLVEAAQKNARSTDGSFSKDLLTLEILPALNGKFHGNKTVDHVRNKLRVWKKQYQPIANLMASNSGFGWNPVTQKITAPEEVWEEYFKHHPEARKYQSERIEDYDDLSIVVGNAYATGKTSYGMGAGINPPIVELPENSMNEYYDLYRNYEDISGEDPSLFSTTQPHEDIGVGNNDSAPPTSGSFGAQQKRKSVDVASSNRKAKVVDETTERLLSSVEVIAENMSAIREICERPQETIDVWQILEETPGLDETLRFKAADMLVNPTLEKMFVK